MRIREYDRMLARGLDALGAALPARDITGDDASALLLGLRHTSFPGLLGLLGSSPTSSDRLGPELLREAAAHVAELEAVRRADVGPDEIERALTAIFVRGAPAEAPLGDSAVRRRILERALEELGKRAGFSVTHEDAETLAMLLSTGEFFADIHQTLAATLFAVSGAPIRLVEDLRGLPRHTAELTIALGKDLATTPFLPFIVIEDLLADGRFDRPPHVLTHTLAALLDIATLAGTAQMISDLLDPGNRSVRLAIVLFARAHGLPIEEKDLDLLREQVFGTQTPDLGPVLVQAVDRLLERHGRDGFLEIVRRLAAARS